MAFKSGIVFFTIVMGCLALPTPDTDLSQFFEHLDLNAQGRIVGGILAPEGSHPHMVSMCTGMRVRNLICGGSILTQRTVLTAAHCIVAVFRFGSLSSELRIRVGSNRWNNGGVMYTLSSNATHEHYESTSRKNDLGVLYTRTPIVFSETICAIALDFEHVGAEIQTRAAG
ncbi:unnamed protein product [Chilo suppressalis]|uniref:Peptidase S1 domain-containing protein n=1 Tax=Chilo suppressalis TaxID=168631 RepID=A0ABN8AYA0_CHISP|nr:unnamed protein product [Chilo suppressalis]